jgi:hypothetical protein
MNRDDPAAESEILDVEEMEVVEDAEDVPEENQPEIIIDAEEPAGGAEENQPEIIGVEEMETVEEAEDKAVEEIEEVQEVQEEKRRRPPTTRRTPTTKRPRTTSRSLRERRGDRPSTQRMGTRQFPRSGEQKAKLIVMAVTAGLLLVLIICALGRAMKKPPPERGTTVVRIQHRLDHARDYRRKGEALIRQASTASSKDARNALLAKAEGVLRKSISTYTGLIEEYRGPQYSYLHDEAARVTRLIYHCQKNRTL